LSDELIHLPPVSILDISSQPVDAMIDEVASMMGKAGDPEGRNRALSFLDRATDRLNMDGVFLYRRKDFEETNFTDGQFTLTLPADWGWPEPVGYSFNEDDPVAKNKVLEWKNWPDFSGLSWNTGNTGIPEYCSIRSDFDGLLYLYPSINTAKVSKLQFPYIARLQKPSEADTIYMQSETREALISLATALAVQFRYIDKPNIWGPMMAEAMMVARKAKGAARRFESSLHITAYPDETGRLRPGDTQTSPGSVYLRL